MSLPPSPKHDQQQPPRERLAGLDARIGQARDDERTRIARDIHDDLGGNLIGIKMALARLAARLPADQPDLIDGAAYLDELVERSIESVHRISLGLRAPMPGGGIAAALAWQAREFEQQTGIPVVVHLPAQCPDQDQNQNQDLTPAPDLANALFRVTQEALTNIARHAAASQVTLTLGHERGELTLTIADNGRGMEKRDGFKPHSAGLRGMRERASALGGTLTLSPAPGGGTMVTIKTRLAPAASMPQANSPQESEQTPE